MSYAGATRVDLGELIRRILVHEKPWAVTQLAAALGLTPGGLHVRLRRGARFNPDELVILLRELPDERLARWMLAGTGLLLVRQPTVAECEGRVVLLASLLRVAGECLAVLLDLAAVLEGSLSGPQQHAELENHLDRAQSVMLQAKSCLAMQPPNDGPRPDRVGSNGFGTFVNEVVVKEGRVSPRQLAASLALGYHALHARLVGRVAFAPDEIRRLLQLHPDPRIAQYLLDGTPYVAIARPVASGDVDADYGPVQTGLLSLYQVIRLMGLLLGASDPPTCEDVTEARQQIGGALRQLAAWRWRLTRIGHQAPDDCREREALTA